jgi:hypothetical protein
VNLIKIAIGGPFGFIRLPETAAGRPFRKGGARGSREKARRLSGLIKPHFSSSRRMKG